MGPGTAQSPTIIGIRLSVFYIALFLVIGVMLPFWPVWMQSRGMTAAEIGLLMGLSVAAKVFANPIWAELSDRRGQRRVLMIGLSCLALCSFTLFYWTHSFWPMLAVTVLFFFFWSPLMPLVESTTVLSAARLNLNYGRIRLWGSASFILAAAGAGWLLTGRTVDAIYVLLIGCLGLVVLSALCMPDAKTEASPSNRFALLALLRNRPLMILILAAALIQSSHGGYYAFGTIYWQSLGISDSVIGLLWAEGVVIEIIFFIVGANLIKRIGPVAMLLIGGVSTVLRWPLTAMAEDLWIIAIIQSLHALSYGATHLAAIHFIADHIPPAQSSSVQSLYSAMVMGLGLGLVMFLSGQLYANLTGGLFWVMGAIALFGCFIGLPLLKQRAIPRA